MTSGADLPVLHPEAKIAAAKLGWTIKPFVCQTSATGAMQAAIASKVNAIYGVSLVKQAIAPQLAAAKAAGIPVIDMTTTSHHTAAFEHASLDLLLA